MKRLLAIILCFVSLFLLFLPASAHSGGTDSKGGHYDHINGGYHYHHGYPAHQHPGGVCPYNNNDATERTRSKKVDKQTIELIVVWSFVAAIILLMLSPIIKAYCVDFFCWIKNKLKKGK